MGHTEQGAHESDDDLDEIEMILNKQKHVDDSYGPGFKKIETNFMALRSKDIPLTQAQLEEQRSEDARKLESMRFQNKLTSLTTANQNAVERADNCLEATKSSDDIDADQK